MLAGRRWVPRQKNGDGEWLAICRWRKRDVVVNINMMKIRTLKFNVSTHVKALT